MTDYFTVGKITSAHGIKGEVKVLPLTNNPERFYNLYYIWIFDDKKNEKNKFEIESVRILPNGVYLKLKGIESRNDAERFKGLFLKVDEENTIELDENEYFIKDLLHINVYADDGKYLGSISDVLQTGANDVYVVKGEDREILLPAIRDVVKKVDIKNRTMIVHLLEGL